MKTCSIVSISLLLIFITAIVTIEMRSQTFKIEGDQFLLNGKASRIFSGEMHYNRIPPEYWKDRLLKARAMGLNTICTYVFWDLHEPRAGEFDFSGGLDVARYIRTAKEVGLNVVIRPGPYVCSEWDFGGLPSWLLKNKDIKVRCMDPKYLKAVERYITRLGKELAPLQITHGGPIILVQVENEYGSYGNDKEYLRTLKSFLHKAGFNVPFYTSDGGADYLLEAGTLPDVLPVVNFGGAPQGDFAALAEFRSGIPSMNGEFWCGWFTHWGDTKFGKSDYAKDSAAVRWMLENGKSFNLYMFHGGTNFGWMAGANFGSRYEPDITSYDYDAPLDEAGNPTKKFVVFKELLSRYQPQGTTLPPLPGRSPTIEIQGINITEVANLFDNLPPPKNTAQPKSMEELDQDYGFVLYRTMLIGPRSGNLTTTELHDYGTVYLNGVFVDTIDRTRSKNTIKLPPSQGNDLMLDILVEGMGRVNFGQQLIDRKGITERVTLRGVTLMKWQIFSLPMNAEYLSNLKFSNNASGDSPKFFRGTFSLSEVGDTFLDVSKWKKGVVWINGHNLGRYWDIGPQFRLFVPGPWLHKGKNEIIVFDQYEKDAAPLKSFREMND
jgi:beta-galactosidase